MLKIITDYLSRIILRISRISPSGRDSFTLQSYTVDVCRISLNTPGRSQTITGSGISSFNSIFEHYRPGISAGLDSKTFASINIKQSRLSYL
jgi:hypothetical protein